MSRAVPPTDLPAEGCVGSLRQALAERGGAVLEAAPGAGKSTVMPLRLLDEPWLGDQRIVMLEPRRLAVRAVARRLADLLGEPVGQTAGYRTRDERVVSDRTRVEVVTEGLLTRHLQRDPSLPGIGLVILDEVHERSLDGDLALAFTLDARAALRPDLRVLAMSATLDTDRLAAVLGGDGEPVPVVRSEGRNHPVAVRWASLDERPRPAVKIADRRAWTVRMAAPAIRQALAEAPGDVLVFLPGAAEIRRTARELADPPGLPDGTDVHALYGALGVTEQDAALAPSPPGRRRVVLATDIAETSLTVPGVRIVVDAGLARRPSYDPRTGLTRLHTTAASQASAAQRAGRAGRTEPGVAYRLWSEAEHRQRPAYTPPEVAVADLAGLVLQVAVWGSAVDELPFVDHPPARALADATELLRTLHALDPDGRPTAAGRAMAELPLHPRLARMVIDAGRDDRLVATAIAALLGERDVLTGPRDDRPADLTERVRLVMGDDGAGGRVDRVALATVRRRFGELLRRSGDGARRSTDRPDPAQVGRVLVLAYPDRIAQARSGGRFRLRSGPGVEVAATDGLRDEPFLVVAEVAGPVFRDGAPAADVRVRLAAPLDPADVERLADDDIETTTELVWDAERDDLRRRTVRRLDALELAVTVERPASGPDTTRALLDHLRATGLGTLRWTDGARTLQARIGFARIAEPEAWPDVREEALVADLDDWLAPMLATATGRADLEQVDVAQALTLRIGHHRLPELDRLAPTTVPAGTGSLRIDYVSGRPTAAVRVQQLFGTTVHPTVAAGRVPVVLELLSPAGRPVQITADLPGFWAGSWAEVRKDMAGRYPKHPWPLDPANAEPPARRPQRDR